MVALPLPNEGIGADQHNTPGTAAEVRPYIEDNYGLDVKVHTVKGVSMAKLEGPS